MEKAAAYRRLASHCRTLADAEPNVGQRVMLWMAMDAWTVLAEVTGNHRRDALAAKARLAGTTGAPQRKFPKRNLY